MMKLLRRRLRRFGKANKGLAALEFAIIAPMMIFLLFGSVEMIDVLSVNSRAQNVAASISDVVARDTEVSNAEINGLWDALAVLMYPNNPSNIDVRVSSVRIVSTSSATVVWSEGRGMAPRTNGSSVTLNSAMMNPGTSVIMTETTYRYSSVLGFILDGPIEMKHVSYRRSRLVDPIPRVS